jgi:hypothetical protein
MVKLSTCAVPYDLKSIKKSFIGDFPSYLSNKILKSGLPNKKILVQRNAA